MISSFDNWVVSCSSYGMYLCVLCVQFMLVYLFATVWVLENYAGSSLFLLNKCLLCIKINTLGLEGDELDPCEHLHAKKTVIFVFRFP